VRRPKSPFITHLAPYSIEQPAHGHLPLGTVDASVIALAKRLNITTVVTLDRWDFGIVRPTHVPALTLLP
jgi:predicted nucleic acid-binding protein